jgi:hypothetical protein
VPGPERIVQVEVPKIEYVVKEKPVERIVKVEDSGRVQQLTDDNRLLKKKVAELESRPAEIVEKEIVVEKQVVVEKEVPVEVERAATGDLRQAARLLAASELNKEDLTADEIFNILKKGSDEDVKRKLGFWAIPLPKNDEPTNTVDKRYIGKA